MATGAVSGSGGGPAGAPPGQHEADYLGRYVRVFHEQVGPVKLTVQHTDYVFHRTPEGCVIRKAGADEGGLQVTREGKVTFDKDLNCLMFAQYLLGVRAEAATRALSNVKGAFAGVRSDTPVATHLGVVFKEHFRAHLPPPPPPVIAASSFVSPAMVQHLMTAKKNSALGQKYRDGDRITNMQAALHTFVTPLCLTTMSGDYRYAGGHGVAPLPDGQGRQVIMSAAIQPDFEFSDDNNAVILRIAEVPPEGLQGEAMDLSEPIPSAEEMRDGAKRRAYDERLRRHLVFHLTADHKLPATTTALPAAAAQMGLDACLRDPKADPLESVRGVVAELGGRNISLEVLYNLYLEQLRNEFTALEAIAPQGYVYTIDPPAIFIKAIGRENASILNRLQALAFRQLQKELPTPHLRAIGFNDFADGPMVDHWKRVVPGKTVVPKKALFPDGHYAPPPGAKGAGLVLHNNSDGLGQNIETEGPTSLDGALGTYSNAAWALFRERPDLCSRVIRLAG